MRRDRPSSVYSIDPLMNNQINYKPYPMTMFKVSCCSMFFVFAIGIVISLVRVSNVESQYTILQNYINELQGQIQMLQLNLTNLTNPQVAENITALQINVSNLYSLSNSQENSIQALQNSTQDIQSLLNTVQNDSAANYAFVQILNSSLFELQQETGDAFTQINDTLNQLSSTVSGVSNDLNQLQQTSSSQFLTINGALSQLSQNLTNLNETFDGEVSDLENNLTALQGNLNSFETNVAANMTAITTNLSTITQSLTQIDTNIELAQSSIQELLSPVYIQFNFTDPLQNFANPPSSIVVASANVLVNSSGYIACYRSVYFTVNISNSNLTYDINSGYNFTGPDTFSQTIPLTYYNGSNYWQNTDRSFDIFVLNQTGTYQVSYVFEFYLTKNTEEKNIRNGELGQTDNIFSYSGAPSIQCWLYS